MLRTNHLVRCLKILKEAIFLLVIYKVILIGTESFH